MGLLDLILMGIALAMDAFAVAVCKGLSMRKLNVGHALIVGLYFGAAQAAMPLIGYFLGVGFEEKIKAFDHWIAFVLLSFIGGKMLVEAIREKDCEDDKCHRGSADISAKEMFPLALATSIDALAVGVSFAFLNVSILPAISVIGITTFLITFSGVGIGCFFGAKFKKAAQIAGGIMLILIGLKILIEHLLV